MTYAEKVKLYREGNYLMPVPPTYTGLWTDDDWIAFIDRDGKWVPSNSKPEDSRES